MKIKTAILIGTEGTILGPTAFWLFCQVFYGYITFDEFLINLRPPKLWMAYVIVFAIFMFAVMNRKITLIMRYIERPQIEKLSDIEKIIRSISSFLFAAISAFCIIGPGTYIIPSGFYSSSEYLLSEILAAAFIFSSAIPWFFFVTTSIEKLTNTIPLSKKSKLMPLRTKLIINMLITTVGTMIILIVLNLSIAGNSNGLGEFGQLKKEFLVKNIVVSLFCLIIVIINFFILAGQIINPVNKLISRLRAISEGDGDLTLRLNSSNRDEIGELVNDFNSLLDNTQGMVSLVKTSAKEVTQFTCELNKAQDNISNTSNEIVYAIEGISEGSSEQAKDLQQTKNTLNNFGQEINLVTRLMVDIAADIETVNKTANGDSEKLSLLAASIQNFGNTFDQIRTKIDGLDESIKQINDITILIKNIADQTNMLSLNAAIESARAGESGRGFSVVAEQIRRLAEQTKTSSENINVLVDIVSEETKGVVATADNLRDDLSAQISAVKDSIDSYKTIITYIGGISPRVEDTSNYLTNINNEKEGILNRIEQISTVAEDNSAATQEITASTENMNALLEGANENSKVLMELTEKLNRAVDRFKV